ncbi:E3 ubiquitin-protein ligase RNF13 [Aethina tumida]|uniref:E3 ubiquitin-protein ligase RNF13 n=1 Tax=Aethina tumida TaxID=116153 RepID=UPI00096B556F|nr:E3 ubiquitin-protein ligase RNF13 [Aethina tumida]
MISLATICVLFTFLIDYTSAEIYALQFDSQFYYNEFEDMEALFGPKLSDEVSLRAMLLYADPPTGCEPMKPPPNNTENETGKWVVLVPRYNNKINCSFEEKVRYAQRANYDAVIVHNINSSQLVPMSAKNSTGIVIPSVFVSASSGMALKSYTHPPYFIVITGEAPFNIQTHLLIPFAIVVGICFIVMIIFMIVKFVKDRRRQRRHRLPASTLKKIPTCKYQRGDPYEMCVICLDEYIEGEKLRVLPCNHVYHMKCIDPWLTKNRRVCPICKRKVFAHDESQHDSDSDSDADDTTPLINPNSNRGTQGGTFDEQTENPIQRAGRSVSQISGATTNFVTTSDHHSINGEYDSLSNSQVSASDDETNSKTNENPCANPDQIHVHTLPEAGGENKNDLNV